MCGALRPADSGKKAVLMGWVNRRRDLGNLIFIDIRDRSGVTQVVFNKERDPAIHQKAEALRNEYVIAVVGTANSHAHCHPVTFRNQVFERVLQIGESSVKAYQAPAKALARQERRVWRPAWR